MKKFTLRKTAGVSLSEIYPEIENGGRFVAYCYCISIVALTFKQISHPYFIRAGEPASKYRIKYTLRSLLFGWWGLPWGPIYTIDRIRINIKSGGGLNLTTEILQKLKADYSAINPKEPLTKDIIIEYRVQESSTNATQQNGTI